MELETIKKCPFCFSDKIIFLLKARDLIGKREGEFYLVRCQKCGLIFQNPRVQEKDIGFYYQAIDYFRAPRARTSQGKNTLKEWLKRKTLQNHFSSEKKDIFWLLTLPLKRGLLAKSYPVFEKNGKLLEIGCSAGSFLQELKGLGWQAQGVEMSSEAAAFANQARGLDVETKKVEECFFPANEFDAIIMNMVLEHFYAPFETLKKISQWLKPKGELIFSIPYFQGFEFSVFKKFAYGLQLPTHQTFFPKKILRDCLKKSGFQKIKFYCQAFDRDIVVSSQYRFSATGERFFKLLGYNKLVRLFFIKPFVCLLALLGKTSRITIRAQKI